MTFSKFGICVICGATLILIVSGSDPLIEKRIGPHTHQESLTHEIVITNSSAQTNTTVGNTTYGYFSPRKIGENGTETLI